MTVSATIGQVPVSLLNGTPPSLHDTLDQRSTIRLVVLDEAGALHFEPMAPVVITCSYAGTVYEGYVDTAVETNLYPNAALTHVVTCFDQHYLADKRSASGADDDDNMSNQYAGENVVYLIDNYLAEEGVTASYAQRRDSTLTDFQAGTLTGVVATNNVGDGNVELATAGVTASTTFGLGARDFATGATLTSVDAAASGQPFSQLNLKAYSAIKFVGTNVGNLSNTYAYWELTNDGATVIASGDTLQYDVWISSTSPAIQAAIDFSTTDGNALRDFPSNTQQMHDQNFIKAHPGTDLKGYADDQWYHRTIDLTLMAGKTISHLDMAFEADAGGVYQAYFRNVFIYNASGGVKKTIFDSSQHAYAPQQSQVSANYLIKDNGYTTLSATAVTVYDQMGTWISPAISIDAVKLVRASLLSWTTSMAATSTAASLASGASAPNVPAGTTLTLYTSIDNKATWQVATFESAIPNLMPGFNVAGRNVYVKAVFAITSPSPELSPILTALQATVSSSWTQVKTDSITTAATQTDFNTGNYTNAAWYSAPNGANSNLFPSLDVGVALNGFWTGWDRPDGLLVNTTTYTALATTNVYTWYRQLNIYAISGGDIRVKLNNAPNLQNFTAQLSVAVREDVSRENGVGFVYRTTNWANANETWAYTVMMEFNAGMGTTAASTPFVHVQLGRANNAGTTTGTYVSIADVLLPFVPAINTFYTLKVVVNGNSHKVYVDDVLWINATDSTWTAAGGFGIRYYNASGNGYTGIYDNFGVVASLSGQWDNGSGVNLGSSIGTVGNSLVAWDGDVPSGGAITALTSVDGGLTYQTATNGGTIPNLPPGTSTTGRNVRVKFLLTSSYPVVTPILKGFTIWLTKQTNASGSRVAPGLDLSGAGRAGSTLVNWNGNVPPGCGIFIDTAPDNKTWTNIGGGASGSAQIAGIQSQLDPIDDSFDSNTSGFYASTFQTGGATATWTWDTGSSRVEASGGTTAFLLYNSLVADDIDLVTDMDTSDAGGLVWRFVDSNNFYDLVVSDPQSPLPSTATLCKVANGTRATLATVSINWTQSRDNADNLIRGSLPHRIRMLMLGGAITVSFDGVQILTYTDHFPLAPGSCGLRTNTISGASAANFYKFRVVALGDSVVGQFAWTKARLTSTDPTATPELYDITTSVRSPNIGTGTLIPSTTYSVLNGSTNTLAADLDDMARQSNYWWKIKHLAMYFQSHNAQLAPFLITGADILLPNSPVSVSRSGTLYRNTSWILGGTDTSLVAPETFKTDGFRRTFTLQHPVSSLVGITDGAKNYTFGVAGIDVGRDFYYTLGSADVPQDASALTLAPGLSLTFTYNGQTNVVAMVSDASEVRAQAQIDQTSGIVEVAETAQGLSSSGAAALAASREAVYTAKPETISFTTARVGLAVGQLASVFLPQHKLVDWEGLITDVVITWRRDRGVPDRGFVDDTPYFTITATSGPIMHSWATTLAGLSR